MSLENRQASLKAVWQIVKNANEIYKEPLPMIVLVRAIESKLGVGVDTAEEYISMLKISGFQGKYLVASGYGMNECYVAEEKSETM